MGTTGLIFITETKKENFYFGRYATCFRSVIQTTGLPQNNIKISIRIKELKKTERYEKMWRET
jgi:hypothetical protein